MFPRTRLLPPYSLPACPEPTQDLLGFTVWTPSCRLCQFCSSQLLLLAPLLSARNLYSSVNTVPVGFSISASVLLTFIVQHSILILQQYTSTASDFLKCTFAYFLFSLPSRVPLFASPINLKLPDRTHSTQKSADTAWTRSLFL